MYRGAAYAWLNGVYFYADFGTGRFFAAWRTGNSGPFSTATLKDNMGFQPSSFGEDNVGELYALAYNGTLYKLKSTFRSKQTYLPGVSR